MRDRLRAEVKRLRAFVTDCTETAGGMVNGNILSHRAKEPSSALADVAAERRPDDRLTREPFSLLPGSPGFFVPARPTSR